MTGAEAAAGGIEPAPGAVDRSRTLNLKTAIWQMAAFLDRWHGLLLALAAPLLWFPSPIRSPVLLVVPAVWVVGWIVRREPLPSTPLNGTFLLLSLMVLVSIFATYDMAASLAKISGMVLGIGIFYAIAREGRHPGGWWLGFLAFVGVGVGIAGVGLLGTRWIEKLSFLAGITSRLPARLTSLSGSGGGFHPNQVAGSLSWAVPVFISLLVLLLARAKDLRAAFGRGRAMAIVSLTAAVTLFVTGVFVLTQSRSGYIGFALSGLTLISIVLPPRGRRLFLSGVAILAIIVGVILSRQGANAVLEGLLGSDLADDPAFSHNTLPVRLELWSRAIQGIQDFPFTGMGMDNFRRIIHVLYPSSFISPDKDMGHAHNEFLQAALDLGIPGLIAFLALHVGAFWMLGEIWRAVRSPEFHAQSQTLQSLPLDPRALIQTLVLGFGGGLLAHMLYGLTDAVALGAKQGILFWMVLGLIAGLFSQVRSARVVEWAAWPGSRISARALKRNPLRLYD